MGRVIRISSKEALAAGLLDPAIVRIRDGSAVGKGTARRAAAGVSEAPGSVVPAAGHKKKRPARAIRASRSRATPSEYPSKEAVQAGRKQIASAADQQPQAPTPAKGRRRSQSRPAIMPGKHQAMPGTGSVERLVDGRLRSVTLDLDVVPVPKERARIVRVDGSSGRMSSYTPKRTRHFTKQVVGVARHVVGVEPPMECPVSLSIRFMIAIPKSWPKWKREAALSGLIAPATRPDMDNLEKALLDALNGIVFQDDALVVRRIAEKVYAERAGIHLLCERLERLGIHASREDAELLDSLRAEE